MKVRVKAHLNRFEIGIGLSFFINQKLGILAVFLICAYKKEIHVGDNAAAFGFPLKLAAEIGLSIVKKFHFFSVRERVFQIDEFAGEYV